MNKPLLLLKSIPKNTMAVRAGVTAAVDALVDPKWVQPSPEQAAASDYYKPVMTWHGMAINIENPAGTVREGFDENGQPWRTEFKYAYGELAGTLGVDNDPVDVFIGPYADAREVYIVRQQRRKAWHEYDEDKVMLDFPSMDAAREAYLAHYDDIRFFGGIIAMPLAEFLLKVKATANKPAMIKALLLFNIKS